MTKTELLEALSTGSELTKKQVGQVLDVLGGVIGKELAKKGSGIFILPGLLKISRVSKPAGKAGKKPEPVQAGRDDGRQARDLAAQRRQGACPHLRNSRRWSNAVGNVLHVVKDGPRPTG